ncbi:MAG: phosphohydrolase, partial [Lachnospiraceae bacterium]|nr:phosphohydrolase [Lachnospiraceae bacterium]
MRAIARDNAELKDKLWDRFNRCKDSQAWYYRSGAASLRKLGEYEDTKELYKEFANLVDKVFGE